MSVYKRKTILKQSQWFSVIWVMTSRSFFLFWQLFNTSQFLVSQTGCALQNSKNLLIILQHDAKTWKFEKEVICMKRRKKLFNHATYIQKYLLKSCLILKMLQFSFYAWSKDIFDIRSIFYMPLQLHDEKEYKSLMKIAGYQFPIAVGCLLSWQWDSGLQSCRNMSHVKKRKNDFIL